MDFSSISTLSEYIKNIEMQTCWKQRQQSGDFYSATDYWIQQQRQNADGIPGTYTHSNLSMDSIRTKILNGSKLSYEEEEYLRNNDPVTYQNLKASQAQAQSYERELKSAKTKDDVDRIKFTRSAASLTEIASVQNNSEVPDSAKYSMYLTVKQKADAINAVTVKFMQSNRYASLPTDIEKREAEEIMSDNKVFDTSESVEDNDKATETDSSADTQYKKVQENADAEKNENFDKIEKVRRAKARALYNRTIELEKNGIDLGTKINVTI